MKYNLNNKIEELFSDVKNGILSEAEGVSMMFELFLDNVKHTDNTIDDEFSNCALEVQKEFDIGGLAGTIYEEYARAIFEKYMNKMNGSE